MTFGEHLEELRACLFKALIGLVIGVAFGLLVGESVVRFIQRPLQQALTNYYKETAKDEWKKKNAGLEAEGHGIVHAPADVEGLIEQDDLLPEDVWIEVDELAGQLAADEPGLAASLYQRRNPPGHPLSKLGPTQIIASDLVDASALCREVVSAGKSAQGETAPTPARRIWNLLSAAQQSAWSALAAAPKLSDDQRQELATALDGVIHGGELYDQSYFAAVDLRPEAKQLLQRRDYLSGAEEARLGRVLLESAFPQQIAPSHPALLKLSFWRPTEKAPVMRPVTLNAQEAFMIYMKASIVTGIVLSSPWVFYQLWSFVAAGLYPHEKRYIHIFLPFSLALFLAGASLAFFFVFEPVLTFLFSFNRRLNIDPTPRISEWLSFVLMLPLGFGISFQLPLVMLFAERIGVISVETYLSKWRIAIFAIFVIAAVLTPADPWSMVLMAIPLTFLYYIGVLLCKHMPRGRSPFDEPA
ncbi:MAG: twin-arginine translocase subunit TatC [Planctomycetaceae bacterium]|nr:twin-arginine translocase subunit TatC [Planctomycetaceae bacterium]